MQLEELKASILKEHRRDLRLTITWVSLVFISIAVGFFLLNKIASAELVKNYFQGVIDFFSSKNENQLYYIIAVSALGLGGVIWAIVRIYKLSKRPQKIQLFFEKVQQGAIASNISESVEYKMSIPLIKIRLKLFPITFIQTVFDQEHKIYRFPIPPQLITVLKTNLSGVSSSINNKSWEQLFEQETTSNKEAFSQVLKSDEEIDDFVQNHLLNDIQEVEKERKKGLNTTIIFSVISVLVLGAWFGFQYLMKNGLSINPPMLIAVFVGISFVFYGGAVFLQRGKRNVPVSSSYEHQFKTKIFKKLLAFINTNFVYILHGHISLEEFINIGIFEAKNYDLKGNDQIIGVHEGVPFQMCDLSVHRKRNFTQENSSPDEVFLGQIFMAKFNKNFKNEVYLIPKKIERFFSKSDANLHMNHLGNSVKLEDPEFMKLFNVYSNDQIEARYILSPSLMSRIKEYQQKNNAQLLISFKDNRITVANYSRTNNFEVSMMKSLTKNNVIQRFYQELKSQLMLIEELKLNVNIWK